MCLWEIQRWLRLRQGELLAGSREWWKGTGARWRTAQWPHIMRARSNGLIQGPYRGEASTIISLAGVKWQLWGPQRMPVVN